MLDIWNGLATNFGVSPVRFKVFFLLFLEGKVKKEREDGHMRPAHFLKNLPAIF